MTAEYAAPPGLEMYLGLTLQRCRAYGASFRRFIRVNLCSSVVELGLHKYFASIGFSSFTVFFGQSFLSVRMAF
jgi:hypothetical protein